MNKLIQELQDDIEMWASKTFDAKRPESTIKHLEKETRELLAQPYDLQEYADVGILWLNAASKAGFTVKDLIAAMIVKHSENKMRKWGPPDKDGVCEHVRDSDEV